MLPSLDRSRYLLFTLRTRGDGLDDTNAVLSGFSDRPGILLPESFLASIGVAAGIRWSTAIGSDPHREIP